MKNKIMIGDVPCWWQECKPVNVDRYMTDNVWCPLCGKEFYAPDGCILIVNNNKLFPNIQCHNSCAPNGITEEIVLALKKNYEDSKALLESVSDIIKQWFPHIKIV